MNLIYDFPPLVGFGLSALLAFLVIRQHRFSFLHRVFFAFLVSISIWALTIFFMRTSRSLTEALVWEKAIFAVLPVVSVTFFHFTFLLCGVRGRRGLLFFAYACMIGAIALAPTDLIIAGMRRMWYGHGFIGGKLQLPYMALFYGFVIIALYYLLRAYRRAESGLDKNRYAYVAFGASLCLFGLLLDVLAASGVHIYPMGLISNILFSLVTSYAMLKFHLLDFHMVVRKGAAYATVSAAGIGVVIGSVYVVYLFGIDAWGLPGWVKVIFIAAIAIILQPVLGWTQSRVDKWFYRERYDYLHALETLSEETRTITNLQYIAGSLVNMVTSAMKCRSVAVLLPDAEDKTFVPVASRGVRDEASLSVKRDSVIAWWLTQQETLSRTDIVMRPQFKALGTKEKEFLRSSDVELFVPLQTREGLRGILMLGRKLSEQDYSPEETRMIRVMTRQMATTLDNARLYDVQMRRYREQALLARLSTAVSAEFDVKRLYPVFYRELKDMVTIDYASVNLVDERGQSPVTAFATTTLPGAAADYASLKELRAEGDGEPVNGEGFLHLPDVTRERKMPVDDRVAAAGIRSVIRLPLRAKGGSLGSLVLAAREPNAYNTDDVRLLQQVGVQLAIAIDKSRIYELERKARQELEKQDRERTDLVNALVHEIKTPLTAILASSELLREELAPEGSTLAALAANLDTAARNLDRRISELMSFARLQTGMTALQLEPVDINEVIKGVAVQINELLQSRDQTLGLDLQEAPGPVKADTDRITQILLNLLTNASKFSGPSQKITLRSYTMNSDVVVEVKDSAPPLGSDEMQHIFQPYYRRSKGKGSGGLGLGLFICQKLVQLHGGKIWVEPNKAGNSFKFSLPLAHGSGGKQ